MKTFVLAALAAVAVVSADFVKQTSYADATCSADVQLEATQSGGCRLTPGGGPTYQTITCVNASAFRVNVFMAAGCSGAPVASTITTLAAGCTPPDPTAGSLPLFTTMTCVTGDYSAPRGRAGMTMTTFGTSATCAASAAEGTNWVPNTAGQCRAFPSLGFAMSTTCGSAVNASFYAGMPGTAGCTGSPVSAFVGAVGSCNDMGGGQAFARFACSSAVGTLLSASAAFAVMLATTMLSM